MNGILPLGTRWKGEPIPPVPEMTTYFVSGPLRLGVEYRYLNDDVVEKDLAARTEETYPITSMRRETKLRGFDTQGLSLHVGDLAGNEYLRFDFFGDDPHYHYVLPGDGHVVIMYDQAANGPMLDWAMECLRNRLSSMLNQAGADELVEQLDEVDVDYTITRVKELAASIEEGVALQAR